MAERHGGRPPSPKIRLADIAREARVGTATVERVLNARGNVAPATARRVIIAAQKLGYDRTLPALHHAAIRIEVILVRPETAFFARLNAAFARIAPALRSTIALYRTFLEENTPEEIARRIEAVAGEREALIVVVQDHPRIVEALKALDRRGVPVILLVSDVAYGGKAVYVGIDNASAGRTAGYLMRQALGGRSGSVLTICHSGGYVVHRERVIGFSQHFADADDPLQFRRCLIARDTEDRAHAAMAEALAADPTVVGVYHAGGAIQGAMTALVESGRAADVVSIGHELSATTRTALERGAMFVAIDQEPELQVQRAIETAECLVGLRDAAPNRAPVTFRIVTPENMA